jgi:hypothetical protein
MTCKNPETHCKAGSGIHARIPQYNSVVALPCAASIIVEIVRVDEVPSSYHTKPSIELKIKMIFKNRLTSKTFVV